MNKKILLCVALLPASFKTNSMQPRMRLLQLTKQFNTNAPHDKLRLLFCYTISAGAGIGGLYGGISATRSTLEGEFYEGPKPTTLGEKIGSVCLAAPLGAFAGAAFGSLLGLASPVIIAAGVPGAAIYYGEKALNKPVESKAETIARLERELKLAQSRDEKESVQSKKE